MDLIESENDESAERLNRYLNYEAIQTGDAVKAIEDDYRKASKQREIEARLPEVWNKLLQEKNEFLLLAVMEKAKVLVGYEPTAEQVLSFLISLEKKTEFVQRESSSSQVSIPQTNTSDSEPSSQQKLIVTMSDGKEINHHHAKDTFVETIEILGLEEVNRVRPQTVSTELFYPHRNNWKNINIQRGKFYINVHNNTANKKRILEDIAAKLNVVLNVESVEKS